MVNPTGSMRICYLLPELKWGGSEKHVIQLAAGLRERGQDVGIACLFRKGPLAGEAHEKKIPLTCLNLSYRWGMGALVRIADWIRSNPMDILHTYLFGFHLFAGFPARLLKVPILVSSRREIPYWQKWRHRWVENAGNLFVDRVVTCSKAVENWTLQKERIPRGKVLTLYNGVDGNRFDSSRVSSTIRRDLHIPSEAPLIGTVANMAVEKGYPYLLEATRSILEKCPQAWFLFVGSGPLEQKVKAQAQRISGHKQIVFAGARTDIPDLLGAMDIFVLASVVEGFPNVLLEALAMGRPVVATRVGGVPELIESAQNGILVPPRDGKALSEAVLSFLKDPRAAQTMGQKGEEQIRKTFTLERMLDQYQALYLSLLRSKGKWISENKEAALSA